LRNFNTPKYLSASARKEFFEEPREPKIISKYTIDKISEILDFLDNGWSIFFTLRAYASAE